jgi:gliding-associated putative ABC transporter substrate-binding component GldG
MHIKKAKKWEDLLQFIAVLLLLILINIHAGRFFFRIDLTEEKRYTISGATKKLLQELEEPVYIEVFLEGDLNPGFKRLRNAAKETLDEFKAYSGQKLQYTFTNPDAASSEQERNLFYRQLASKGLSPTNLFDNVDGKRVQKVIFPGAIISYKNKETPVALLKGNKASSPQEQLNQSVEGVEYELASALKKLVWNQKKRLAFIEGHQELQGNDIADLMTEIDERYAADRVNLEFQSLDYYDAAILMQPKKPLSEAEKFKLDQFLMQGGRLLFFLDMVQMNIDSISRGGAYAFGYDLNLNDMLFKYGVRLNMDLVQDLQMGDILLNVGDFGNAPNIQRVPWPYYPILNNFGTHPITRNLNAVFGRFVSTIDTVKSVGEIRKTPLLFTSQYTRIRKAPTLVSLDELKDEVDPAMFNRPFVPIAYMLEGNFSSLYKNRFAPESIGEVSIKEQSENGIVVVIGDGDLGRNEIDRRNRQALPLGFEPASQQTFSNKDFIINLLQYTTDGSDLINTRMKEIAIRPLDKVRIQQEKEKWQILNMLLPVLILSLFGATRHFLRKRRYESYKAGDL